MPSGDSPDGTGKVDSRRTDAEMHGVASVIPVGGSPTGTGESPVPPIVPTMPFDYVDFDVKLSEKPQKFYRVRQP